MYQNKTMTIQVNHFNWNDISTIRFEIITNIYRVCFDPTESGDDDRFRFATLS